MFVVGVVLFGWLLVGLVLAFGLGRAVAVADERDLGVIHSPRRHARWGVQQAERFLAAQPDACNDR